MKPAVGVYFPLFPSLSKVVDDRGLLARKMLSAVEKNIRDVGLVDILDRDSLGHERRTGLEAIESLRRKGVRCPGTPLEV